MSIFLYMLKEYISSREATNYIAKAHIFEMHSQFSHCYLRGSFAHTQIKKKNS